MTTEPAKTNPDWEEKLIQKMIPTPSALLKSHWLWVGVLALLMQIPIFKISSLITERQATRSDAENEITSTWGGSQVLSGPVLSVPYMHRWTDEKGLPRAEKRFANLLPDDLDYAARVNPEIRKRGIFEVPVYALDATISGRFDLARVRGMGFPLHEALWNEARITMPFSELNTVTAPPKLTWQGRAPELNPSSPDAPVQGGLEAAVALDPENLGTAKFSLDVKMNGSNKVRFMPQGKETRATLASSWTSPSFSGAFLPKKRASGNSGFSAEWGTSSVTRAYPQQWLSIKPPDHMEASWHASSFGVDFATPTDAYSKTARSVKYSLLFIAMTFMTFYLIELFRRNRVHMLQYALVGMSLCLFYLLLLSLAEHMAFGYAYGASTLAVLLLTGLYAWAVFGRAVDALGISAALGALYGYLYVVLNAEDHALLFGTLGLLCMLAGLMYATRRLNAAPDAGKAVTA
jgi:inner membrane protein